MFCRKNHKIKILNNLSSHIKPTEYNYLIKDYTTTDLDIDGSKIVIFNHEGGSREEGLLYAVECEKRVRPVYTS